MAEGNVARKQPQAASTNKQTRRAANDAGPGKGGFAGAGVGQGKGGNQAHDAQHGRLAMARVLPDQEGKGFGVWDAITSSYMTLTAAGYDSRFWQRRAAAARRPSGAGSGKGSADQHYNVGA